MRAAILAAAVAALAVAACDLRPAPRLNPEPAVTTAAPGVAAPGVAAPGIAGSDAIAADAAPLDAAPLDAAPIDAAPLDAPPADAVTAEASADCIATAQAIAGVVISGADPGVRGNYERARAEMVRTIGTACTQQAWSADKQTCFRTATVEADIRACEDKYPKPR